MADTVSNYVIMACPAKLVQKFLNKSDGTGESNVKKIDISTLTNFYGVAPASVNILKIVYDIQGMKVQVIANGTSPAILATIGGHGELDYTDQGGLNSKNAGTDGGDINFTTIGAASGSTYDITLHCLIK